VTAQLSQAGSVDGDEPERGSAAGGGTVFDRLKMPDPAAVDGGEP